MQLCVKCHWRIEVSVKSFGYSYCGWCGEDLGFLSVAVRIGWLGVGLQKFQGVGLKCRGSCRNTWGEKCEKGHGIAWSGLWSSNEQYWWMCWGTWYGTKVQPEHNVEEVDIFKIIYFLFFYKHIWGLHTAIKATMIIHRSTGQLTQRTSENAAKWASLET